MHCIALAVTFSCQAGAPCCTPDIPHSPSQQSLVTGPPCMPVSNALILKMRMACAMGRTHCCAQKSGRSAAQPCQEVSAGCSCLGWQNLPPRCPALGPTLSCCWRGQAWLPALSQADCMTQASQAQAGSEPLMLHESIYVPQRIGMHTRPSLSTPAGVAGLYIPWAIRG